MSEPNKELDPGTITVVLDANGTEVGVVYTDRNVESVNAEGHTWQVLYEHWYLYPSYGTPRDGASVRLKGVDPSHVGASSFATQAQVESYARQKNGGSGAQITYDRARVWRRILG